MGDTSTGQGDVFFVLTSLIKHLHQLLKKAGRPSHKIYQQQKGGF